MQNIQTADIVPEQKPQLEAMLPPATTPTFTIPPHLMGRNIDNPAADMIGSGRKSQKPRLGVRVPYRNLTSQIVSQNEIAQELFERSLKRHPIHNTPEGGDVLFTKKLTQRLAHRLSSSAASMSIPTDAIESRSFGVQFHNHSESGDRVSSCTRMSPPPLSLMVGDGIEIGGDEPPQLEPYGDLNQSYASMQNNNKPPPLIEINRNLGRLSEPSPNKNDRPPVLERADLSHISAPVQPTIQKLDPRIERELALKQLMELPIRNRKKATTTKVKKSPQKVNVQVRRGSNQQETVDSENNNQNSEVKDTVLKKVRVEPKPRGRPRSTKTTKKKTSRQRPKMTREIERLLMDEGAINILYEMEHGDSRRRSSVERHPKLVPKKIKKVRSRGKLKKDLVLKRRLVKNAVLRLSTADKLSASMSPCPEEPQDPLCASNDPYMSQLPASRIIRRHSSSSNFSSRSASPTGPEVASGNVASSGGNLGSVESNESLIYSEDVIPNNKTTLSDYLRDRMQMYKNDVEIDMKHVATGKAVSMIEENMAKTKSKVLRTYSKLNRDYITRLEKSIKPIKLKPPNKEVITKKNTKEYKCKNVNTLKKQLSISNKSKGNQIAEKPEKFLNIPEPAVNRNVCGTPELMSCLAEVAASFAEGGKTNNNSNSSLMSTTKNIRKSSNGSCTKTRNGLSTNIKNGSSNPQLVSTTSDMEGQSGGITSDCVGSSTELGRVPKLSNSFLGRDTLPRASSEEDTCSTNQESNVGVDNDYKTISLLRDLEHHVVQIIMNPSNMHNFLTVEVFQELCIVFQLLTLDESCHVVLLTSVGHCFSLGVDLPYLVQPNNSQRVVQALTLADAMNKFITALTFFNKPIVAGIHGPCIGLAVTMLPLFDMVLATTNATFYTPYARLGQIPEGGASYTFPNLLGCPLTAELLYACKQLTAAEAENCGLITRVILPSNFETEVVSTVESIGRQSLQGMMDMKQLLRHNIRAELPSLLKSEGDILRMRWSSDNFQVVLDRFFLELNQSEYSI